MRPFAIAAAVAGVGALSLVVIVPAIAEHNRQAQLSEVRTNLSGLFTAMKSFQGEY